MVEGRGLLIHIPPFVTPTSLLFLLQNCLLCIPAISHAVDVSPMPVA